MRIIESYLQETKLNKRRRQLTVSVLTVLSLIVAVSVSWNLHLTGITMANGAFCGQNEHIHTEECVECTLEEHLHELSCYSDPNADVEDTAIWEATLPDTLTGRWSKDIVAIAKSQIGYLESERNFILADDGETRQGYTRYGAWYGNSHGEWNVMFLSFCMRYADIPNDIIPSTGGAYSLRSYLEMEGMLKTGPYTPKAGDIIIFEDDTIGIVTEIGEENLSVIIGDFENTVAEKEFDIANLKVSGYVDMTALTNEHCLPEIFEQSFKGEDYTVEVVYDTKSELPEGATLTVTELTEQTKSYTDTIEEMLDENKELSSIRLFDISFTLNGEVVEPLEGSQVGVSIFFRDGFTLAEEENLEIFHFDDSGGAEKIDGQVENNETVEFSTDSFSVYAVASSAETRAEGDRATITFDHNNAFYAEYGKANPTYTVRFDANGGSTTAPSSITVDSGNDVVLPDYTGTNGRKVFVGWSTINNATDSGKYTTPVYKPNTIYTPTANVRLYATWASVNVDAKFFIRKDGIIPTEPQGHSVSEYTSGISIAGAIKIGEFYTNSSVGVGSRLNQMPTDEQIKAVFNEYDPNTQFILWYVVKHEETWHVDGVVLDKSLVSLSYDANAPAGVWTNMPDGAQFPVDTVTYVGLHGGTGSDYRIPSRNDGYIFVGWNTEPDGSGYTYQTGDNITMTESKVLYAEWKKDTHTLILNKVDSNDDSALLPGATFTLYKKSETGFEHMQTLTTGSGGRIDFGKIETDTIYKLVEDKPPGGYSIINESFCFKIATVDGALAVVFCDDSGNEVSNPLAITGGYDPSTKIITVQVENLAGYALPSTGGIGTYLFIICGLILIISPLIYGFSLRGKSGRRL
ncbi:InlB B-repeat-containing protein [Bacillus sp. AGMB 02131]|uniref:InlB B-repeat-containing protein n=1 Tax=Peribacillus faecalis TaxID=2772559 RepID=A0A927CYT5_9BACI|nr:InlB B-repeat-containing protein [Peribacillus faecalis]MBD3109511.1 InlB B-repeat-containing protein [Peribacillus faecalis]